MNNEEIDSMLAGRDMDMLIAENVLGAKFTPSPFPSQYEKNGTFDLPDGWRFDRSSLPYYSTSIEDAWKIVEYLNCDVAIWSYEDEPWACEFNNGNPGSCYEAGSVSLAICRAALKMSMRDSRDAIPFSDMGDDDEELDDWGGA